MSFSQKNNAIPPPKGLKLALIAMRAKTLLIAITPVLTGTILAFKITGDFHPLIFCAIIFAAFLIQIGTNLYNDAEDALRGNDGEQRLGPQRVTANGWLKASQIKKAGLASFALAALCGLYLVWLGGLPILILGLAAILAGIAYSAGPIPLSHTPLGELFVLFFFGIAAMGGTVYLQTGTLPTAAPLIGTALGFFAAAVLFVNNIRDRKEDHQAGRRTLALLVGRKRANFVYGFLMIAPYFLIPAFSVPLLGSGIIWLPFLSLPFALFLTYRFTTLKGKQFNGALVQTVQLQLLYALLLCTNIMIWN